MRTKNIKSKSSPKTVVVKPHRRISPKRAMRTIVEQFGEPSVGRKALKDAIRRIA